MKAGSAASLQQQRKCNLSLSSVCVLGLTCVVSCPLSLFTSHILLSQDAHNDQDIKVMASKGCKSISICSIGRGVLSYDPKYIIPHKDFNKSTPENPHACPPPRALRSHPHSHTSMRACVNCDCRSIVYSRACIHEPPKCGCGASFHVMIIADGSQIPEVVFFRGECLWTPDRAYSYKDPMFQFVCLFVQGYSADQGGPRRLDGIDLGQVDAGAAEPRGQLVAIEVFALGGGDGAEGVAGDVAQAGLGPA